jgi:hypothetical protein
MKQDEISNIVVLLDVEELCCRLLNYTVGWILYGDGEGVTWP